MNNILNHVVKTRLRRLLFSVLLPPATGALIYIIMAALFSPGNSLQLFPTALILLLFGYIFMGLQSLAAGLIMEFVVLEHAVKRYQIVTASVLLGTIAGATMMSLTMCLIGAAVGLMIGWVFRRCI